MNSPAILAISWGLVSALLWGAGDFAGGLASRKASAYRVVLVSEWSGLLPLVPLFFYLREPFPPVSVLLVSMLASLSGVVGIVALYRALAEGQMSVAAPVSALLAAVIPVVYDAFTQGFPGPWKLTGFCLAFAAIWLVSAGEGLGQAPKLRWAAIRMPFLAGITFGVYFILMNAAGQHGTFWPLASARVAGGLAMTAYFFIMRPTGGSLKAAFVPAVICGVLDVSANGFYLLAGQAGRLDVAAVLGSLYPGGTVLLAWLFLKERINLSQAIGIALTLLAIILIAR